MMQQDIQAREAAGGVSGQRGRAARRKAAQEQAAHVEPALDDVSLRVLKSLRRIIQAVDVHSRRLSALYQVTVPQLVCLLTIVERGPITSAQLAREVNLSASTLVGILDRLEAAGYVRRERGISDRRVIFLTATEEGRAFALRAPSPLQETFAEGLAGLPAEEQRNIADVLETVARLMGTDPSDERPALEPGPLTGLP